MYMIDTSNTFSQLDDNKHNYVKRSLQHKIVLVYKNVVKARLRCSVARLR